MKKVLIAGGSGFIGVELEKYLSNLGYSVYILTRNPKRKNEYKWDARTFGEWTKVLEKCDILINLTGKSVDCRYTEKNKKEILDSRIESSNILAKAINKNNKKPSVWLNASSATIYDHSIKHLNTEENGIIGDDFSMNVCKKWEEVFFETNTPATRKIALRMSIVMGENGGALPILKKLTSIGLGGKQGNGLQKISWIRIEDLCKAIHFIIKKRELKGVINVTSPFHFTNAEFMKLLRKYIGIPFGIPQAKWLLEIGTFIIRSQTELILKSRYVYPQKLLDAGFTFSHESPFDKYQTSNQKTA